MISHFLINAYATVVNELATDFPNIVASLLCLIIFMSIAFMIILFVKGAFKKINNRVMFMSLNAKILYMIFSPTIIIFISIMLYNALQYKV